MSRNLDSVFTDVFSYPAIRQELQLSSLYEQPRTQAKTQVKSHQYPHAFGHSPSVPQPNAPPVDSTKHVCFNLGVEQNSSNNTHMNNTTNTTNTTNVTLSGVVLPPMRRVVKFALSSTHTTLLVAVLVTVNTVMCVLVPTEITPVLGTLWGGFLHIWMLITVLQLLSHSVYMCTTLEIIASLAHLSVISICTILIPRSLFAKYLWLAPCLCTVIVTHQSQLFCLVYTHLQNQWIYALIGSICTMVPMIFLIQADASDQDSISSNFILSVISVYTLYGFAFANSKGCVLIDVTVGASPIWQSNE